MAGVLGLVVLMVSGSHAWQLAIVVILLGMSETNNTLNGAIMADFFGRERYATLYGWLQVPNQLMSMPAPVLVGWIFDHTGSYFWALVLFSIINAVAAVLYWTLPRPKIPSRVSEPRTIDGR